MKRLLLILAFLLCSHEAVAAARMMWPVPIRVAGSTPRAAQRAVVPRGFIVLFQLASCDYAVVKAATDVASTDDVVQLPACSQTDWQETLIITTAIHLKGAGTDQTIIGESTSGASASMIRFQCTAGEIAEVSGFTFVDGARGANSSNGVILVEDAAASSATGDSYYNPCRMKIHDNEWDHVRNGGVVGEDVLGVIYRNTFRNDNNSGFPFQSHQKHYGGGDLTTSFAGGGDRSWFKDVLWGTEAFVFFEDNTIINDAGVNVGCHDGTDGERYVFRFNDTERCAPTHHGTENRRRGVRAAEIYANDMDNHNEIESCITNQLRSGTVIMWDNTLVNPKPGTPCLAIWAPYRLKGAQIGNGYLTDGWGAADGYSPWDYNDPLNPYTPGADAGCTDTGEKECTVSSVSTTGTSMTITVSGANWAADEWNRYSILKTSTSDGDTCPTPNAGASPNWVCNAIVLDTDDDTITVFRGATSADLQMTLQAGDTFTFNKVTAQLDMNGMGKTTYLISGGDPATRPNGWTDGGNNQEIFPSYEWDNFVAGVMKHYTTENLSYPVTENVHYYNYVGTANASGCVAMMNCAFTGATGSGKGAIADRPTTCTTGVAYWATDEGDWNDGSNANYTGQGQMYKCTATNTWTLHYEPYTYPHPLRGTDPDPALDLSGINPISGPRNATTQVDLSGTGLFGSDAGVSTVVSVSKSGGSGLSVDSCAITSDVAIDNCNFVATAGATLGDWNVAVTTDEGVSNAKTFTVTAAGGPILTSLTPSQCMRGTACAIAVVGTALEDGSYAMNVCTGLTVSNLSVTSATAASFTMTVAVDAPLTQCDVTFTNNNGTSNEKTFQPLGTGVGPRGPLTMRGGR